MAHIGQELGFSLGSGLCSLLSPQKLFFCLFMLFDLLLELSPDIFMTFYLIY